MKIKIAILLAGLFFSGVAFGQASSELERAALYKTQKEEAKKKLPKKGYRGDFSPYAIDYLLSIGRPVESSYSNHDAYKQALNTWISLNQYRAEEINQQISLLNDKYTLLHGK